MKIIIKRFALSLVVWISIFSGCLWAQVPPIEIQEPSPAEPQLKLSTDILDFGLLEPNMEVSRRVEVTNRGAGVLSWKVVHGRKTEKLPYFISLVNAEGRGMGYYQLPAVHRESIEITGVWKERQGWPVIPTRGVIRYNFYGTGVSVHYWKFPEGGKFSFYCDQYWLGEVETQGGKLERARVDCVAHLPFGRHTLTVMVDRGETILDGFEVIGRDVQWASKQQVKFLPDGGVTTKEIDYVTITVNPHNSPTGLYGYVIDFLSNGGEESVYLSWEVKNEGSLKVVDVFRYVSPRGNNLFTTDPQADEWIIRRGQYKKEGIAFRLFHPGTPSTVEFYRWYNPLRDSYFYSANKADVEKIERGYLLEGPVGNIATTKLRNTRELYRWYNPKAGFYFYTPLVKDPSLPKGYRFDGIVGYVPY